MLNAAGKLIQAKIESLKRQYDELGSAIESHTKTRAQIAATIEAFETMLVRDAAAFRDDGSDDPIPLDVPSTTTPHPQGKYSKMGITDAVFDVIENHQEGSLFVPEIVTAISNGGVRTKASDLYAITYAICKKLCKQKRIIQSERDGKRSFMRQVYR
ncbi:MAG TPA: hypothetical protein VHB20_19485 [Verrucomicrobiae bacterium]|jgi:hypothetical protein|nr:hypothetical protein [Verrucomicrobiae bacterium]